MPTVLRFVRTLNRTRGAALPDGGISAGGFLALTAHFLSESTLSVITEAVGTALALFGALHPGGDLVPFTIVPLASGATRISLEGDLDVFTVDRLWSELLMLIRRRPNAVELDLSRLRSVGARAMDVLGGFFVGLTQLECRITVIEMQDQPVKWRNPPFDQTILSASRLIN